MGQKQTYASAGGEFIKAYEQHVFGAFTVEQWLSQKYIDPKYIERFPNAKIAAEIKASPLAEALK